MNYLIFQKHGDFELRTTIYVCTLYNVGEISF